MEKKYYLVLVESWNPGRVVAPVSDFRRDLLILAAEGEGEDERVIMDKSRALCLGDESGGRQRRPMDDLNVFSIDVEGLLITLNTRVREFSRTAKIVGPEELRGLMLLARRFNMAVELLRFARSHDCPDPNMPKPYWLPVGFRNKLD